MKFSTLFLSLAATSGLFAQETPAPAPAPTPEGAQQPATPVPGAPSDATAPPPAVPEEPSPFKTPEERLAYAIGVQVGNQLKATDEKANLKDFLQGLHEVLSAQRSKDYAQGANVGMMIMRDEAKLDAKVLAEAITEIYNGGEPKMSQTQIRNEMTTFQQNAMKRREAKAQEMAAENQKVADEFLAKNKTAEGVKTTESGLQYKVITEGKGPKPKDDEVVLVHFTEKSIDGREVGKSLPGTPRTMGLNYNKGWGEALKLMNAGSKFVFWVPPALAWGATGRGTLVKPNTLMYYEVELVESKPRPEPAAATPPIGVPGNPVDPNRKPITATTPPVAVEIPPDGGKPQMKTVPEQDLPKKPETDKDDDDDDDKN